MKRTQIQLDEQTWEALRERAFRQKSSVAALIREIVGSHVTPQRKREEKLHIEDFKFVGRGRSRGREAGTIAQRHDEEFAEGIL